MNGGETHCHCGAVVHVPEAGQYIPCPKCRRMVTYEPPPVQDERSVPPAGARPQPQPQDPTCPVCNAPTQAGANECLACGFHLGARARPAAPEEGGGVGKYILLAVALLILGAGVGGMVYVARKEPEPIRSEKSGYMYDTVHQIERSKKLTALLTARQNIAAFQALEGRYPESLDELAQNGLPVPPPPEGFQYDYDPRRGNINLINAPQPPPDTPPAE